MNAHLPHPKNFLDRLFALLPGLPTHYAHLQLDHLCYRVETREDYAALRTVLFRENELLTESTIGGRPIAVFRLARPYIYGPRRIDLLELPAPKPGRPYPAGWEHAEFVTDRPLPAFRQYLVEQLEVPAEAIDDSGIGKTSNPDLRLHLPEGLSVKFHEQPLDAVIAAELAADN